MSDCPRPEQHIEGRCVYCDNNRLREALIKYGDHGDCSVWVPVADPLALEPNPCDCGWDEILAAAGDTP